MTNTGAYFYFFTGTSRGIIEGYLEFFERQIIHLRGGKITNATVTEV